MPARRLSTRETREILRLRGGQGVALRAVARSVRCSASTLSDCVARAQVAGLRWPLPVDLDDEQLDQPWYRERGAAEGKTSRPSRQVR